MLQRLRSALTLRRALALCTLGVAGVAFLLLFREAGAALTPAGVRSLLAGYGAWGPAALILALALLLVAPVIPATILQIGAGLAFGPWLGLAYTLAADLIGASAGFWLARRWGRSLLDGRLSPESRATLNRLAQRISWRSMLLLRLLPGPAYPLVSFAAGYSPISFLSYIASSFLGVLPSLALLALAGDLVTNEPLLAFGVVVALAGGLALAGRWLRANPESSQ